MRPTRRSGQLFATVLDKRLAWTSWRPIRPGGSPKCWRKITEENFDATFNLDARATLFTVRKACR